MCRMRIYMRRHTDCIDACVHKNTLNSDTRKNKNEVITFALAVHNNLNRCHLIIFVLQNYATRTMHVNISSVAHCVANNDVDVARDDVHEMHHSMQWDASFVCAAYYNVRCRKIQFFKMC